MITTKQIQAALAAHGFNPGPIDGIMGRQTEAAIVAFNKANGFPAAVKLGDQAILKLNLSGPLHTPWLNETNRYMGLHEIRDNAKLWSWLKSGGGSVGDPARIPWCADLVETAIKITLPDEPFPRRVGKNPYYSLNWLDFGHAISPCYGAIAIFIRPGGGHIGFLVGYDPIRKRYRVRGGNQSNAINDTWLDEDRLRGVRWPSTYGGIEAPLPIMDSTGAVISTNEA